MKSFLFIISVIAAGTVAFAVSARAIPQDAPYALEFQGRTDVTYKKPKDKVAYECGRLEVPAGTWRLSYRVMGYSARLDTGTVSVFASLVPVDTQNVESAMDPDWNTGSRDNKGFRKIDMLTTERIVTLSNPVTYKLVIWESEGSNWDQLQCLGGRSTTLIRAEQL